MGSSLATAEQSCSQQVMAVKMRVQTTGGETGCWPMTVILRSVPAGLASLTGIPFWGSTRCCTASRTKTEQYGDGYLGPTGSSIEVQRRL